MGVKLWLAEAPVARKPLGPVTVQAKLVMSLVVPGASPGSLMELARLMASPSKKDCLPPTVCCASLGGGGTLMVTAGAWLATPIVMLAAPELPSLPATVTLT